MTKEEAIKLREIRNPYAKLIVYRQIQRREKNAIQIRQRPHGQRNR